MVYHMAANPDIRLGTRITDTDLKEGTIATYNVMESMRISKWKKIAFTSSSVVYGENAPMPTPENHGPVFQFHFTAHLSRQEKVDGSWVAPVCKHIPICKHHRKRDSWCIFDFIHKLKADPSRLEIRQWTSEKSYMEVGDCVDAILHVIDNTGR